MHQFLLRRAVLLPLPPEEVFPFFADAGNLERITPPWLNFSIVTPLPMVMRPGALIDYRLRLHGIPIRWRTEIAEFDPPNGFVDQQLRGPYRLWHHTHRFRAVAGGTLATDEVRYGVPGYWPLERLVEALFVAPELRRIFDYRTRVICDHFNRPGLPPPRELPPEEAASA